jgi:hypothetical protein
METIELVPGRIWLVEYPVRYSGLDFRSRMTVIRLAESRLMLHSPCEITPELKMELEALGEVRFIVAPGNYHYLHVPSAQQAFPDAETWICPGIERKRTEIEFDWILGDQPAREWEAELDQVLVRGTRFMWEVAFFDKPSKTLVLVDLVENIGDATAGVGVGLKIWWKFVFRMWNKPKPAPEYQLGWNEKVLTRRCLERVLEWDFERVVLSHGDLIEHAARDVVREAWAKPLGA